MSAKPLPQAAGRRPTLKTLSIGGATQDLFVDLTGDVIRPHDGHPSIVVPLGHKVRVTDVTETTGGGAANTSVGLARLGCEAAFCGVIGSDQWGERLLQTLNKEGVETCCATIVEGETSSFSIILRSPAGERAILNQSGTNAHLHDATFDKEHARTVDWIYLNRLHDQSMIILDDVLEVLTEKPGIGLSWNPGGSQIEKGMTEKENALVLKHTSLLFLNKEEALTFTGQKNVDAAIASLIKAGAKTVCVTDGRNGVTASDGTQSVFCPAVENTVIVDTTGAGDAFGTGATWAKLLGLDLPMMLCAGTINATSVLGAIGAQAGLLTDIEIRARLKTIPLDVTVKAL